MRSLDPPRSGAAGRKPAAMPRRPVAGPRPARAAPGPPAPASGGLPEGLQAAMEAMSGFSLADVVVHRDSAEPARLGAAAFTRGSHIHVASGEERHLPHEAWHVVQQKQGRVRPTMTRANGAAINADPALEREADAQGARAGGSFPGPPVPVATATLGEGNIIQAKVTAATLAACQNGVKVAELYLEQYFDSSSERFIARDHNIWLNEDLLNKLEPVIDQIITDRIAVQDYYKSIGQADAGHETRIRNLIGLLKDVRDALRNIAAGKKRQADERAAKGLDKPPDMGDKDAFPGLGPALK